MIEPGSLKRAIESLEGTGYTEALQILRILQTERPFANETVDQYALALEDLSHPLLAMHAACATAQRRLVETRLAHVRAEIAQLRAFENVRDSTPLPPREPASEAPTLPSPSPESEDGR